MVRIEKSDWFKDRFVKVTKFTDLLRQPVKNFETLTSRERDNFRQTQINEGETVRLLGHFEDFSLVMKYEGTLGWIPSHKFSSLTGIHVLTPPPFRPHSPEGFLGRWKGVPYIWGGLSQAGIDCSGFTQLYYLHVLRTIIPKNSRDQRRLGKTKEFSELNNHDLVFCHRLQGEGIHHVALFYNYKLWHARQTGGIVAETPSLFLDQYHIESVISLEHLRR